MNMDYHIILKLSKFLTEYQESVDKELKEKKKSIDRKTPRKPRIK
jgi:hypothetical protein